MRRVLWVLAGVLGCGPSAAATAECEAKVEAMRTLFAHGPADPFQPRVPPGLQLPVSRRGAALEEGWPLYIRADGSYEFDHKQFPNFAAVREVLLDEVEKAGMMAEHTGRPWTTRWLLLADARAPVTALLGFAEAMPKGTEYALVVEVEGDFVPVAPPVPVTLHEVLTLSADEYSMKMAEVMWTATGSCTAVHEVFAAIADTPADLRGKLLFDDVPTALATCKCEGVDVETVVAALWTMNGKKGPAMRQFRLPMTDDPGAPTIAFQGETIASLVGFAETADKPFRMVPLEDPR